MSRPIEFRVWSKKYNTYFELSGIHYENGKIDGIFAISGILAGIPDVIFLEPEDAVLEQSTGLKDKNGKEIYEGDIVSELVGDYRYSTAIKGVIEQYKGGWAIRWGDIKNGYSQLYYEQTVCEIIGNVHENPELLEGEK